MIMVIGSVPEWKQDESVGPNMELVRELRGARGAVPSDIFLEISCHRYLLHPPSKLG